MIGALVFLIAWFIVSLLLGMVIGRWLRDRNG